MKRKQIELKHLRKILEHTWKEKWGREIGTKACNKDIWFKKEDVRKRLKEEQKTQISRV